MQQPGPALPDFFDDLPCAALILDVQQGTVVLGNAAARALYRREGYSPVGIAHDYSGRGAHGVWMQKQRTADKTPPRFWR